MPFVSSQGGISKKKTGKSYKGEKPGRFFFQKNRFSSFVWSCSGTYYALFLGCLDLKFLPDIPYCVYWDVARFEPQIRSTRFVMNFLFIIATTEKKVRFCMKLFDNFLTEYSSIWAETCRVSSQIMLWFFHKISIGNSFWKMFQKLLALQGAPLFRCAKFFPNFCNFILSWYYTKKFQNHLHK